MQGKGDSRNKKSKYNAHPEEDPIIVPDFSDHPSSSATLAELTKPLGCEIKNDAEVWDCGSSTPVYLGKTYKLGNNVSVSCQRHGGACGVIFAVRGNRHAGNLLAAMWLMDGFVRRLSAEQHRMEGQVKNDQFRGLFSRTSSHASAVE